MVISGHPDAHFSEFYAQLDKNAQERLEAHERAIALASQNHEQVRNSAEQSAELYRLHVQREWAKQRDDQERALQQARLDAAREQLERERERQLNEQRIEQQRREAEELARRIEQERLEAEERWRREQQETRRREQAEAERQRKEQEQAAAAARAQAQAQAQARVQTQPAQPAPAPITSSPAAAKPAAGAGPAQIANLDQRNALHKRYLELHKKLKDFRKFMLDLAKMDPAVKGRMGDMRREIKMRVGQLTTDNTKNTERREKIIAVLEEAKTRFPEPAVAAQQFMVSSNLPAGGPQVPALLVYQLHMFAKAVLNQFKEEAGIDTKLAGPVGILASYVFSDPRFKWQGHSFSDILLAKLHKGCPVLFGIYGNEKTEQGRQRLGWPREGGSWASEQRHQDTMSGYGAGYAALSLRIYRSARTNPFPPRMFWQTLALIVNTPARDITETHYIVLKAMVEHSIPSFARIFDTVGLYALRSALVDFASRKPGSTAAQSLGVLREVVNRDEKFSL
ncbi:GLE1-like protein-domain-containing protein [Lineolata rhizophorae]|uniref:mRNA export factor GLE1 n=1 Tax=Lineolata rhizophorae TaxID=578093 RepID=A0A6A6PBA4_9PEZI|nr:GLE1-like protein-domain-containing protein [Lineolata rhizophorae]